jgi:VanZ family protein
VNPERGWLAQALHVWCRDLHWWGLWLTGSFTGLVVTIWLSLRAPTQFALDLGDKWQHGVGYAVLTLWFCGLVRRERQWRVVLVCAAYGVFMEVLQGTLTPDRMADPYDALANASGALIALTLAKFGFDHWAEGIETLGRRWWGGGR